MRVELVHVRLHLVAAALVDDFAPHDAARVGHGVARRRERAFHAVRAFADHHLDYLRAAAEEHNLHRLAGFGDPYRDLLVDHVAGHSSPKLTACRACPASGGGNAWRNLNASAVGPFARSCSSRAFASSMLGRCPFGTHHSTRNAWSIFSNHSLRRRMICTCSEV